MSQHLRQTVCVYSTWTMNTVSGACSFLVGYKCQDPRRMHSLTTIINTGRQVLLAFTAKPFHGVWHQINRLGVNLSWFHNPICGMFCISNAVR
jgi:hypothetical protein